MAASSIPKEESHAAPRGRSHRTGCSRAARDDCSRREQQSRRTSLTGRSPPRWTNGSSRAGRRRLHRRTTRLRRSCRSARRSTPCRAVYDRGRAGLSRKRLRRTDGSRPDPSVMPPAAPLPLCMDTSIPGPRGRGCSCQARLSRKWVRKAYEPERWETCRDSRRWRQSRPIWLQCLGSLNMGRPITVRHT